MKKTVIYTILLSLVSFISSCGYGFAPFTNHNQNTTEVQLAGNNFKVITQVSGSSEDAYFFLIGGKKKRQLYENAYSAMIKQANLLNSSKAIINVMKEEHVSGFAPFYIRRSIIVTAQVIEFTR